MRGATLAVVVVALAPAPAGAHQTGLSYGEYVVRHDRLDATLRLSTSELAAMQAGSDVGAETLGAVQVARGGARCAFVTGGARPKLPDGVRVSGAFQCPPSPHAAFHVDAAGLLARLSWAHTHLAKVTVGDRVEEHVVRADRASFAIDAGGSWLSQAARFLRLGLEHIFTGYDHVAFVLGLLLLGRTLRQVIAVVTSFTVAHSVTLAIASLGWFRLPPSVVEPLIAASIVCVAVENLVELARPASDGTAPRWALGFAFGLVHGFGFAGALTELHLSSSGLATALLSFNVGVELGQAAIVTAAFPLLSLVRRWPARASVLRTGSVAVGLAGTFWLVQRLAVFPPA